MYTNFAASDPRHSINAVEQLAGHPVGRNVLVVARQIRIVGATDQKIIGGTCQNCVGGTTESLEFRFPAP